MRSLVNVKELLEYCQTCKVCNSKRKIEFSVYPDDCFKLDDWKIKDDHLLIHATFEAKGKRIFRYALTFDIDCEKNTVETKTRAVLELPPDGTISTAGAYTIELGIYGKCENLCSYVNAADLQLNIVDKTCSTIGIDSEHIYIFVFGDGDFKCSLWYDYCSDSLHLSNMRTPDPSEIILPIMDFDFSNLSKLRDKLTSIIIFS